MIPLPKDVSHWKPQLFQLEKPVILPIAEFNDIWSLVMLIRFETKSYSRKWLSRSNVANTI